MKIGVLTSGGDASGMNAALRAVVLAGIKNNIEVYGINRGYIGLINNDMVLMTRDKVKDIIGLGGTIIKTSRCPEMETKEGIEKAVKVYKDNGFDALVVLGGDGSYAGALELSKYEVKCIGIPCTIDNDIGSTDYTLGYDTCLQAIVDMIDGVKFSCEAHERCYVVEAMGREAGFLSLYSAVATEAAAVRIPEVIEYNDDTVIERIKALQELGRTSFIVIVAEGVGGTAELSTRIQEETNIVSRPIFLGHIQRGGITSARDRYIGSSMGCYAIDLIMKGEFNKVISMRNDSLVSYEIDEALKMKKSIDKDLFMKIYDTF